MEQEASLMTRISEQINHRAYQYAKAQQKRIHSLCEPLFKATRIKVFAYFRFFPDGRYLYLCNHLKWIKFCLQNIHSNQGTSLGSEIKHAPQDNYHCFLWPTQRTDYVMDALHHHNIWNGLSLF